MTIRSRSEENVPLTVLLVDDDPLVRQFVATVLEDAGYRLVSTDDPAKAIALLAQQEERVDVLVADVTLPGMSGRELLARSRLIRPDLRCVLTSGYPDGDANRGAARISLFLPKPFSVSELLTAVRAAIGRT